MADSYTGNINLRKPEVGAAHDTWGGLAGLNGDLDIIDAIFLATGLSEVGKDFPTAGDKPGVGLRIGVTKVLNVEGTLLVADSTDTSAAFKFDASDITTATIRTLKAPDADGTIALVSDITDVSPVGTIMSGYYGATAPPGYVFADGRTIGSLISGATNRANADTERLFLHLWGFGFAVVGGRGASAAADWAAARQLTLPNHSGRTMAGRDNLSGTAAGILPGFTVVGAVVGGEFSNLMDGPNETANVATPGTGGHAASINHEHANVYIVQPTIAVDVIIAL